MKGLNGKKGIKKNPQEKAFMPQGHNLVCMFGEPLRLIIREAHQEIAEGYVMMKRVDEVRYEKPVKDYMAS